MMCPRRGESPVDIDGEDEWKHGTCSYCGSLSPEAFLERAGAGELLSPTDKSYKVYVGHNEKFYFQHLAPEQQRKFVELHNLGKLKLEYPGHFYVMPFFMARRR